MSTHKTMECWYCGGRHGIDELHTCAQSRAAMERRKEEGDLRVFATGATRSPLGDKLQYVGYLNPLVLQRFAQYMKKHQTDAAGNQREADNWQKGIPLESLMDSSYRHYMDWWLHHRGYGSAATGDVQEALCAVIFNAMAYLKAMLEKTHLPQTGKSE